MKTGADDPRLTAYALGELSDAGLAKIEGEMEADFALRLEIEEIREMAESLGRELADEPSPRLEPQQREEIMAGLEGRPLTLFARPEGPPWRTAPHRARTASKWALAASMLLAFAWQWWPGSAINDGNKQAQSFMPERQQSASAARAGKTAGGNYRDEKEGWIFERALAGWPLAFVDVLAEERPLFRAGDKRQPPVGFRADESRQDELPVNLELGPMELSYAQPPEPEVMGGNGGILDSLCRIWSIGVERGGRAGYGRSDLREAGWATIRL